MAMSAALHRRRSYAGPALFSYGFRPFFLLGAAWALIAVLVWLPQYFGVISLPIAIPALDRHIHEMLYGYVPAVAAGFLLTAIPNWTGRLPVNGAPLAALLTLWIAGRLAMLASAAIGLPLAACIDSAFLLTLAATAAREIMAARNWRNLRVLIVLGVLIAGNIVFHVECITRGAADVGIRLGIAAVLGLIMLIGGRIIPSFTHNWLARRERGRMPVSFGRFDALALAAGALALAAWCARPEHPVTGVLLLLAGLLHLVRLARWAGERTAADRLVLVLHVGYAFVPTGFLLVAGSILWPAAVPLSAGIHAWTAGAVAVMTLAVMTRASLGHTGSALTASAATQAIYLSAVLAAVLRIAAAFAPQVPGLLDVAGLGWLLAFGAFVAVFGPLLVRRRAF